ncbi:MAG: VWA domain-containing protein [Dolichospermum lemmermannii FEM_B0920]
MASFERIEEYIRIHPNQTIWDYLQTNTDETEYFIGISYQELQELFLEAREFIYQNNLETENQLLEPLEAEILFLILRFMPDLSLDFKTLGLLFQISEAEAKDIFDQREELNFILRRITFSKRIIEKQCAPTSFDSIGFAANDHMINNKSQFIYGDYENNDSQFNIKPQLLPHDGLFIRRNNQFGTRLNIGIKDLIDQGILIDQTNIRFDDFIPLNSDQVPKPEPNQALSVSYGIAAIPLNHKRDERATHYLEIALRTSDIAPSKHPKNKAPSANYIFVIDTSGSMSGDKLNDVKAAIRELFQKLKDDDVIGIIVFNTQVKTLLKATRVNQINTDKFSQIISGMTADGGTDINIALSFGIDEIMRYGNNNTLNHIYLFSDGQPNSGENNWMKIRQNVDAKTRGNIRLSTFAFGSDADTKELDALAGLTGGKSTFVTDIDDIKIALQDELDRREHLAAINVQIKVDIEQDIDIIYLYGHDLITEPAKRAALLQDVEIAKKKAEEGFGVTPEADLITEEKGIKIFVPDLAVNETYWIVFELAIPEEKSQIPIGKTTVQYVDTFARETQKPEFDLEFTGNLPTDLVVEHSLALWTSEVAFYVLDDLYAKDINTAKKRIEKHVSLLRSTSDNFPSDYIRDNAVTLSKFASLFDNLDRRLLVSDQNHQNYLIYSLSSFGQLQNGFRRADYYSV